MIQKLRWELSHFWKKRNVHLLGTSWIYEKDFPEKQHSLNVYLLLKWTCRDSQHIQNVQFFLWSLSLMILYNSVIKKVKLSIIK